MTQQSKLTFWTRRRRFILIGGFVLIAVAIGWLGSSLMLHASVNTTASVEPENGSLTGCATSFSDSSASGGSAVKFASCATNPSAGAGATLPVSYDLASLSGQVLYVAPTGSDSNSGTKNSPLATVKKAAQTANSGATIVLRGGNYHEGSIGINRSLSVIAYPGEIPKFDGSVGVPSSSGWTTAGNLSYRSYTPMPITSGSGIDFPNCQNQPATDCVGRYPDQVWVGASQYQQVYAQSGVSSGKFWVDQVNHRLYMLSSDLSKGNIAVSDLQWFIHVNAPNITLKGLQVVRYSNTAGDYGVISIYGPADNSLLDNMYISDSAFMSVSYSPNSDTNTGSTVKDSTIQYSNWMGISANQTTSLTIEHSDIGHMNQFNEFTASPASGSLKTSRTWYTKVLNSKITDNINTNGLWFDQSNYKVIVAGNDIENIGGASVFYEISDYLYMVNNYINAPDSSQWTGRFVGSSNLHIVNNTFIGGRPVIVATDTRSKPGCSDPTKSVCDQSYGSDRDSNSAHPHPATLTWMPSVNLMINNIMAYPRSGGNDYCSQPVSLCVTQNNNYQGAGASTALNAIFHPADNGNSIPKSYVDGNVYANGTNAAVSIRSESNNWTYYSSGADFGSAMASPPVSISGFEARGYTGNQYVGSDGTPTYALQALTNNAVAVPSDSSINPYVSAGTKHYGVTWK